MFGRDAQVAPESFNADENTIDITWTTGAAVRRCDWWDGSEYDEVLSLEPGAVRLDRLNLGAPFLDTHCSYGLNNVIGSVVPDSARIEDGKGVCKIQLSKAAGVADTVQKIKEGVIRNISVGYWTHKIIKTESDSDKVARWDIVDWEPLEISAVPIPADPGSQVRSETTQDGPQTRSCTLVTKAAAIAPTEKPKEQRKMATKSSTVRTPEDDVEKKRLAALRAAKRDDKDAKKDDEESDDERDEEDADEENDASDSDTATEEDADEESAADDADDADDKDDKKDNKRAAKRTPAEIAADAVAAERTRAAQIRELATRAGLPNFGNKHVTAGTSVRKFRDLMFDRMLDKQKRAGSATVSAARVEDLDKKPVAGGKGSGNAQRDSAAGAEMAARLLGKKLPA